MNLSIPRRFSIEFDTFHKYSWKERLCIAIGYNAICRVKVNVDKRTGEAFQLCTLGLTNLTSAEDVIAAQHKLSLELPEEKK